MEIVYLNRIALALRQCGRVCPLNHGKSFHCQLIKLGVSNDVFLANNLISMYVGFPCLEDARKVFDEMPDKNVVTWTTMVSGYTNCGKPEKAVRLYTQMLESDSETPNGFMYSTVLKACGMAGYIRTEPNVVSWNSIIAGFANNGSPRAFEFMCLMQREGLRLNGFTFPCALKTCSRHAFASFRETDSLLCNKFQKSIAPGAWMDSYTFSGALKACINVLNLRLGRQVHGLVVTTGYELYHIVGSILIDLYARLGNIKDALGLFDRLPKKDTVAWSGLIIGCATKGLSWLAFSLFRDMVYLDIEVDQFVISFILKVCSSLTSLGSGKQVHAFCVKSGYESEEVVVTSLLDMYSKCGEIEDGLALFDSLEERDTVCWTGIIVGCGQNGRAEEAIRLFHQMIEAGLKPNEITYVGVLSACRHAGLVEEARTIFNSMKIEHGVEPGLEHYYCMVDILGQAGYFKEAERVNC
ncbi:pentatricopeptide repeat-containing protein [Prunus yedoensis var. nudiflora]|uniref:Pentatricopeptide repeat-containing protein n=1 Tax=Prunus yedoensis var. nudiflora TaxID=2094558 RepID=A0A314XX40_PRUYE|nr:pentatricopeptide repeat-containing protein [Prunus yedoensis var. nudiflora]